VLFSVSQTELAELYNQTKVYVCASTSERNNLCVLEAAQCGCDIINSTENRGKEWLLGTIAIDVTNPDILKQSILEAYNRDILPVYEVPSWDDIIQLILK
jgi:glycosyltransferase involved in cell wall biosynthesis